MGGGRGWASAQVLPADRGGSRACNRNGKNLDAILRWTQLPYRAGSEDRRSGATLMTSDSQINDYLAQLRKSLSGMTISEREDIVQEIRMHIRERLGETQTSLDSVLSGLGPADELAEQYRTGLLVQRAQKSI